MPHCSLDCLDHFDQKLLHSSLDHDLDDLKKLLLGKQLKGSCLFLMQNNLKIVGERKKKRERVSIKSFCC